MTIRTPLLSLAFLLLTGSSFGQFLEPQDDTQSWNEVQLTAPLDKHFDFSTAVAMRFGKNITQLSDGRFAFGIVWKPHKSINITPFYLYVRARNAAGLFRTEHRLNLRVVYRFPFKRFGLSHRSLIERRLRRPLNSWRYRPSLTLEKDLPKEWVPGAKVFITEEVFYDSLLKRWSRNRLTVGLNKTISKQLSLDTYYMRQNDGFSRPGDLHVIGTTWRVRF